MIELNVFKQRWGEKEDAFPLLTLDEFFRGNLEEDSIAPNQWGYGRPPLAELWGALRRVEGMPEVAWVGVALHCDTAITKEEGTEVLHLVGDTIVVCTAMAADELEAAVNCEWLCSDGVIPSEAERYCLRLPPVPPGYRCLEIVWD